MEPTEKEVEDRLRNLGTRLASPPSDVDELLRLLDQTEIYLSRVEQSPSTSMSDALCLAMNSLISKEFLNHSETDVKVFLAACINEITRITAPDAPYDDDLMKEIFAMIVDAFGKLDDISGRSYSKRISILEIVAKVRSCVVMLDLECDDLILQMFKHFLKSIRPDHPINVFSSMETIMTLILEESEDISQELLFCLLSNVQKSKKGVMPVARRLAEKVISNCAMLLKPYFLVAIQSMGSSLSDYSDMVASLCQESSVAPAQNEADASKLSERTVSDELPKESEKLDKPGSCLEEIDTFADKTRKVLSNGAMPLRNGNSVVEPVSPELKPENSFSSEQCRNDIVPGGENNNLGSITEKPGNGLNLQYIEAKSSSVQVTDASDSSRVDGDKEASAPTIRRAGRKRQTKILKSDGASDMALETEVLLESEREAELRPFEGVVGDNTCVNSASATYNPSGSGLPIRRRVTNSQFSEQKSTSHKPAPSAGKKKMSGITTVEKEGLPAIVSELKDHCPVSISDGKSSHDSVKKSLEDNATADVAAAGISDGMPLRKEQKEAASVLADANTFGNQWKSNINQPKGKDVTERDVFAEPCLKEIIASSKASREANNDQHRWQKFVGASLIKKHRRKEMMASSEASREENNDQLRWQKFVGASLIKERRREARTRAKNPWSRFRIDQISRLCDMCLGRKIEVWWPDDEEFYKGVIDAFDQSTNMHRVVYDDGDVEHLYLRKESWNYIDSNNFERGHENDIASLDSSLQVPTKKRRVRSGKSNATSERGKSGRKFKGMPNQQSGGRKSAVESRGKPRQITSEGTSPNEKTTYSFGIEGIKVEEPSQMNNSDEPHEDTAIIKYNTSSKLISEEKSKGNILPTDGGKSVIRSSGWPRSDNTSPIGINSERTTKALVKAEGIEIESYQTKNLDDTVFKDDSSTGSKLDGESKCRLTVPSGEQESVLKSRCKPRSETLKNLTTMDEETLKTPSKFKGIKIESSQTFNSGDTPADTTAFNYNSLGSVSTSKHGVIGTDEKLKGKDMLKLGNMAGEGPKVRRKRKGTAATIDGRTDANISAIKNLVGQGMDDSDLGSSHRGSMKTNKRRKK